MSNEKDLKGYIRIDGNNRIVAGSLVLRKKKPKVGRWQEVPAYNRFLAAEIVCCETPSEFPCMNYSVTVVRGETNSFSYTSCAGDPIGPIELVGPISTLICARVDTVTSEQYPLILPLGECNTTTTTSTTIEPTTTTTSSSTEVPTTTTTSTTIEPTTTTTTSTSSTTTTTTTTI